MERISYNEVPKGMFSILTLVEDYINESPFDMQLLELIRYRASILNGCSYCVDMHSKELKHTGETDVRLNAISIWKALPIFQKKNKQDSLLQMLLQKQVQHQFLNINLPI